MTIYKNEVLKLFLLLTSMFHSTKHNKNKKNFMLTITILWQDFLDTQYPPEVVWSESLPQGEKSFVLNNLNTKKHTCLEL